MPDNKENTTPEKPQTEHKKTENQPVQNPTPDKTGLSGAKTRRNMIIGVGVLSVLVLGLLVTAAVTVSNVRQQRFADQNDQYIRGNSSQMRMHSESSFGGGRSVQTEVNDGTVTTTVYNYLTGVVISVNGDTIVVAGNGKQTSIKTNSSTTYVNDAKPAVNDTITIAGTTADSVITATQISVANR